MLGPPKSRLPTRAIELCKLFGGEGGVVFKRKKRKKSGIYPYTGPFKRVKLHKY